MNKARTVPNRHNSENLYLPWFKNSHRRHGQQRDIQAGMQHGLGGIFPAGIIKKISPNESE
jgi:hypothetical protein